MSTSIQPKKPFHVAICGGGIGGLLYEAAPAFAEIGAGISFGPNSVRAMELIDPAVKQGFDNCATSNGSPEERDVWFNFRVGMAEDGWKDFKNGPPAKEGEFLTEVVAKDCGQASVHRAHFLDELVEEKGSMLQMIFHDGTTAEADVMIGCDGLKSRIRYMVLGDDHEATAPIFSGKYAYRGLIPMEKAVAAVGGPLARNSQNTSGLSSIPSQLQHSTKGRIVLLGDAAHASTPHQGAGAGQAIEDAFILSNLLGDCAEVGILEER
ncbi:hypothetical protein DID88_007665 [Monilinia fructigena]|uniref:FAD-binding domain-containing protein n=1 Tax=Monilinia fructigena TaxID=38457 RepID=A0A395J5D6_9HELO|nr:hypothetical protein DID88_007665 [Monilinia fructigena]